MLTPINFDEIEIGFQGEGQKTNFNRGYPLLKNEGGQVRSVFIDTGEDDILDGMIVFVDTADKANKATTTTFARLTSPQLYLAVDPYSTFDGSYNQPTKKITLLTLNYVFTTGQIVPFDTLANDSHPYPAPVTIAAGANTTLNLANVNAALLKVNNIDFAAVGVRVGDEFTVTAPTGPIVSTLTIAAAGTVLDLGNILLAEIEINAVDLEAAGLLAGNTFTLTAPTGQAQPPQTFTVISVSGATVVFDSTAIAPISQGNGADYTVSPGTADDFGSNALNFLGGTVSFSTATQAPQTYVVDVVSTVTITFDSTPPSFSQANGADYTVSPGTADDFGVDRLNFLGGTITFNRALADINVGDGVGADAGLIAKTAAGTEQIVGHVDSVNASKRTVTITPYVYRR